MEKNEPLSPGQDPGSGGKKLSIKISKELRDIIHGYTMSDGYIRNGVLTIDQSVKQERFVIWLYDKLQPLRTTSPIKEIQRIHPKNQEKSRSVRFFTRAVLDGFHHMWYKPCFNSEGILKYRKALPQSIGCFFNETFISLWYAGDGTKTTKVLAANQGLYNGFLAAGLVWGLLMGGHEGFHVKIFFLTCVIIAGAYGAYSVSRRILYIQAAPALLALVLLHF